MPLIQSGSEEALHKNIATEIEHGKDPKQAAAIGYSVQHANDDMPSSVVLEEIKQQNKCWGNPE
jgi:hypothetical protein